MPSYDSIEKQPATVTDAKGNKATLLDRMIRSASPIAVRVRSISQSPRAQRPTINNRSRTPDSSYYRQSFESPYNLNINNHGGNLNMSSNNANINMNTPTSENATVAFSPPSHIANSFDLSTNTNLSSTQSLSSSRSSRSRGNATIGSTAGAGGVDQTNKGGSSNLLPPSHHYHHGVYNSPSSISKQQLLQQHSSVAGAVITLENNAASSSRSSSKKKKKSPSSSTSVSSSKSIKKEARALAELNEGLANLMVTTKSASSSHDGNVSMSSDQGILSGADNSALTLATSDASAPNNRQDQFTMKSFDSNAMRNKATTPTSILSKEVKSSPNISHTKKVPTLSISPRDSKTTSSRHRVSLNCSSVASCLPSKSDYNVEASPKAQTVQKVSAGTNKNSEAAKLNTNNSAKLNTYNSTAKVNDTSNDGTNVSVGLLQSPLSYVCSAALNLVDNVGSAVEACYDNNFSNDNVGWTNNRRQSRYNSSHHHRKSTQEMRTCGDTSTTSPTSLSSLGKPQPLERTTTLDTYEREDLEDEMYRLERMTSWDTQGTMNTNGTFNTYSTCNTNDDSTMLSSSGMNSVFSGNGMNSSVISASNGSSISQYTNEGIGHNLHNVVASAAASAAARTTVCVDDDGHAISAEVLQAHQSRKATAEAAALAAKEEARKKKEEERRRRKQEQGDKSPDNKSTFSSSQRSTSNSSSSKRKTKKRRKKKVVKFEYPPISSLRECPRITEEEREKLFFTEDELDEYAYDRKNVVCDDIEIVAVHECNDAEYDEDEFDEGEEEEYYDDEGSDGEDEPDGENAQESDKNDQQQDAYAVSNSVGWQGHGRGNMPINPSLKKVSKWSKKRYNSPPPSPVPTGSSTEGEEERAGHVNGTSSLSFGKNQVPSSSEIAGGGKQKRSFSPFGKRNNSSPKVGVSSNASPSLPSPSLPRPKKGSGASTNIRSPPLPPSSSLSPQHMLSKGGIEPGEGQKFATFEDEELDDSDDENDVPPPGTGIEEGGAPIAHFKNKNLIGRSTSGGYVTSQQSNNRRVREKDENSHRNNSNTISSSTNKNRGRGGVSDNSSKSPPMSVSKKHPAKLKGVQIYLRQRSVG